MTTFRITAQWEFGGEMLGPIDVFLEGPRRYHMNERQDAITRALAIFRRHGSHGNVENIVCVEVNQDEIDGLYMAHHPADGPGHLEEECPCLDGGQSIYTVTTTDGDFKFLNCNCGRSYPLGHHWESCPGFDPDTMDTSGQWKLKPIHTKGMDLILCGPRDFRVNIIAADQKEVDAARNGRTYHTGSWDSRR